MAKRKIFEVSDSLNRRVVKVYRDSEWDEYRVRLVIDGTIYAAADYFTDSCDDAIDTARAMLVDSGDIEDDNSATGNREFEAIIGIAFPDDGQDFSGQERDYCREHIMTVDSNLAWSLAEMLIDRAGKPTRGRLFVRRIECWN